MADTEFQASYPTIWHFLDTTLWPDVDSYNLLEMVHRIMKHGPADWTRRLVEEFGRLKDDDRFDSAYLAELFNRDVPPPCNIMRQDNARDLLWTLAGYLHYLYTEEGLRGKPS